MKVFLILGAVFAFACVAQADNTPVTQCDEGILPTDIIVGNVGGEACTGSPCVINPAKAIYMDLNFTAPSYMESPYQEVYVDIIDSTYPLIEHDACKGITNTACPISEGELVSHHFQMDLFEAIPEVTVGLRYYLQPDQKTKTSEVCFNIKVQIVKS